MAILAFQKPDKVVMLDSNDKFGKFEFRPLEPGFGVTIGNSLRRILLSSLEGYAINTIKISGVEHEFSSVPGVKEDVTNIILNLKQVRFKQVVEEFENEKVSITVENSTEFKAGDKFYGALEAIGDWIKDDDTETPTDPLAGAVTSMSEETGGVIAGRLNAFVINQSEQISIGREQLVYQAEIAANTRASATELTEIKETLKRIENKDNSLLSQGIS